MRRNPHGQYAIPVRDPDAALPCQLGGGVPAQQRRGQCVHRGVMFGGIRTPLLDVGLVDRRGDQVQHFERGRGALHDQFGIAGASAGEQQVQPGFETLVDRVHDILDGHSGAAPAGSGGAQPVGAPGQITAVHATDRPFHTEARHRRHLTGHHIGGQCRERRYRGTQVCDQFTSHRVRFARRQRERLPRLATLQPDRACCSHSDLLVTDPISPSA